MKEAIVGIIVAVIAGVAILVVDYNVFKPREQPQLSAAPKDGAGNSAGSTSVVKTPQSSAGESTSSDLAPSDPNLADLHRTAKKLSDSYTRTVELKKLSEYASSKGEIAYTITIAKDIPDSYSRTVALTMIVQRALDLNRFEIATTAADNIPDRYTRDQNLRRVLQAKQADPKRSNNSVQPTPKSGAAEAKR
jgi:hypothetical protein